ncbi:hypothetical protein COLO4_37464 [Corchorus olitorius]|uniref:Uncharacterized protein n=1 Tax=Corchorus olitorius TaxID=93759 RepID=A0A1R3G1H4_9ROSI|nr:hypothetical protein COLO4_37464 [Corchorus olitorius]
MGPLPSSPESVTSRSRIFRNHVDNLLLREREAARPIANEDVSCEIISKIGGKLITHNEENMEEVKVRSKRRATENMGLSSETNGRNLRIMEEMVAKDRVGSFAQEHGESPGMQMNDLIESVASALSPSNSVNQPPKHRKELLLTILARIYVYLSLKPPLKP